MRISDWSSDVCSSDLCRRFCRAWNPKKRGESMKSRFMLNAAQVALVGAFGMLPSLALAQSDSGPPTTSSTRTSPSAFCLEDIIVTARKREESLQKVPIAVTAITTEQRSEERRVGKEGGRQG